MIRFEFQKFLFFLFLISGFAFGKVFDRCELVKELKYKQHSPGSHIPVWVCIAYYESGYDTRLVSIDYSNGTTMHGIFQLNDHHWCSSFGMENGCHQSCQKFEDDDIADDFQCAQTVFRKYQKIKGDGFLAWPSYYSNCRGSYALEFIEYCA